VIGSLTLSIAPSLSAIPTSAESNDFATENDVWIELRLSPPK